MAHTDGNRIRRGALGGGGVVDLKRVFSRLVTIKARSKYKIIKTDMGYLPLFNTIYDMWRVIRANGTLDTYVESAPQYSNLFHETEEGAGLCINAHSNFSNAKVIWP